MHFDYFGPAMLTIFMAMIGGWVDPMSFAFDVAGLASVIFFVLVVVVPPHAYPYLPTPPHASPYLFHISPYLLRARRRGTFTLTLTLALTLARTQP